MSKIDPWYDKVPAIMTEHLIIRPLEENDLPYIQMLYSDETLYRYLGRRKNFLELHPAYLFDTSRYDARKQNVLRWGIIEKKEGTLVGEIMLYDILEDHYCKMGCRVMKEKQKMGIATEATIKIVEYFWSKGVFSEIQADVMRGNQASYHALKKAGFTREGMHPGGRYYKYMARKRK